MTYSGDAYKVTSGDLVDPTKQNAMIDAIYQVLNTLDTGKASSTHSHAQSEITDLVSALAGKAGTDAATTSANGLMSSTDKTRLDALELAALTIASIESY